MKNFVRFLPLALALGTAGLLAGCTSYRSSEPTPRAAGARDFEVVETSTKRLLSPQEMLQLRIAVAKYLDKEGAIASGDYYVKVYLGPDQDGMPAEWVVVRFTRDTESRYSLLAAYPAYSPGYQSYAAYDYYPYGYDHFSRISFQYYNDPYYGSGYYFPPRRPNHDRDRDRDHDRDRDKDRDGDNPRANDRPRFKPIDPVGSPPQVTRTQGMGIAVMAVRPGATGSRAGMAPRRLPRRPHRNPIARPRPAAHRAVASQPGVNCTGGMNRAASPRARSHPAANRCAGNQPGASRPIPHLPTVRLPVPNPARVRVPASERQTSRLPSASGWSKARRARIA